uniref:ATP-sensitive inward rectifier potassium channel 1-like n=1 Tax=Hirondellea gigas TaxID=1518452 RepID=A0A2P2HYW6_9CRUS
MDKNYEGATDPIILRNGDCNMSMLKMKKQRSRYMMDMYTTIVEAQWRYTLLIFISGFTLCWLFFGFIWYVIIRIHGDDQSPVGDNEMPIPCLLEVKTFTGAFLFSLETQHTIGYGVRVVTEECPAAVMVLCVQSITGVILQAFMAGVVFAKLTRSKARANTLLFSRKAVVCLRDNKLVLMFKVADLRKSLIVGANVKAQLIRPRRTLEGEELPFNMTKVKVGNDSYSEDLLFIWPVTIVHVIDESSPFYYMDASSMLNQKFELVVYLEGTSESTGTTMQARYSYRNGDVLWGNRFEQTIQYDHRAMHYVINFEKLEKTISIPTPLVSAYDWDNLCRLQNLPGSVPNTPTELHPQQQQLVVFDPGYFKTVNDTTTTTSTTTTTGGCESCRLQDYRGDAVKDNGLSKKLQVVPYKPSAAKEVHIQLGDPNDDDTDDGGVAVSDDETRKLSTTIAME